jgi:acyl-CoA synthetase (AMP-forming)/AMP-acid ligase II
MDGYLHRDAAPRRWRTGDLGQLDADGFLTVHGRRDNLIVTAVGRNISPEWIETMLLADLRIGACIIGRIEAGGRLAVLLVPSRAGEGWFRTTSPADVLALVTQACRAAPVYARPTAAFVCSREEAAAGGVLTPNGRVRRAIALAMLNAKSNHSQTPATHEVVS